MTRGWCWCWCRKRPRQVSGAGEKGQGAIGYRPGPGECLASAPGGWELAGTGTGATWAGPLPSAPPRCPPARRARQPEDRGSGLGVRDPECGRPRGASEPPDLPTPPYLCARQKGPRITRRQHLPPLQVPAALARGDDVTRERRAPVTSEANGGGGAGALAGHGSAEKALSGSASADEAGGGGRGAGGGSRGGRRSRASSRPGGRVSGGSEPSRRWESRRAAVSPGVGWSECSP